MLETYDLLIMEFVFKNKLVTFEELAKVFPEEKYCTTYRIELLCKKSYTATIIKMPIPNSSYMDYTDDEKLALTHSGTKIIQDYICDKKEAKIYDTKLFILETMRSVFCPIVAAFITSLITLKFFQ